MTGARMVAVGQFAGAYGVRGAFRIRSFTGDPAAVGRYGALYTADGRVLRVRLGKEIKPGLYLATAPEITSPEACTDYAGAELFVPRSALPDPVDPDEFYLEDLVGLAAVTPDGAPAGTVRAVVNYGAGDIMELTDVPGHTVPVLLPFTRADVPEIDMAARRVVVVLPVADEAQPEDEVDDGAADDDTGAARR